MQFAGKIFLLGCGMNATISLQSVSKSYHQNINLVDVFDDISIDFEQGKSYAIMGASGSGKSTLIHLLAGIDTPTQGDIIIQSQPISVQKYSSLSPHEKSILFQQKISIVFQQASLFAELTVLENIMLKAILAGNATDQSMEHARDLLQEVGLLDKADAYPAMLSGGQQQRIAILRAIFIVPQFLLVDEPTGNLDEASSQQVIDLLIHYHKKYNMGLIVSTHSKSITQRMQNLYVVCDKKLNYKAS
jgi:ABC-type lipoprotein export system ATPase subunit